MDSKLYAPVFIPTLNRYEHFKRCLESLERCTGAEKTDVYIGLDYPPSEKYVEGWKKIDAYLAEKEKKNRFKNLFVRRRDHNCGVGCPGGNDILLSQEVRAISEKYISSEDDNEFSPNFLEYMNKGLEKYKDDVRVINISAYTPPAYNRLTTSTTFFGLDTPAYGLGRWVNKNQVGLYTNELIAKDLTKSLLFTTKLFLRWPKIVYSAVQMVKTNHNFGDIRFSIYNLIKGTFTLQPTVSLSRNWGADGSGLHSGVVEGLHEIEIQTAPDFEMDDIPFEYPKGLEKKLFFYLMPSNKFSLIAHLCYYYIKILLFVLIAKIK